MFQLFQIIQWCDLNYVHNGVFTAEVIGAVYVSGAIAWMRMTDMSLPHSSNLFSSGPIKHLCPLGWRQCSRCWWNISEQEYLFFLLCPQPLVFLCQYFSLNVSPCFCQVLGANMKSTSSWALTCLLLYLQLWLRPSRSQSLKACTQFPCAHSIWCSVYQLRAWTLFNGSVYEGWSMGEVPSTSQSVTLPTLAEWSNCGTHLSLV